MSIPFSKQDMWCHLILLRTRCPVCFIAVSRDHQTLFRSHLKHQLQQRYRKKLIGGILRSLTLIWTEFKDSGICLSIKKDQALIRQGIEAVAFDLDDTLVNTVGARRKLQRSLLVQLGFTQELIRRGISVWEQLFWYFDTTDYRTVLPIVVAECGMEELVSEDAIITLVEQLNVRQEILANLSPCTGIQELLSECEAARIPMGIVSNGDPAFQMLKLEATALANYFPNPEAIVICKSNGCKPHPGPLIACSAALSVQPAVLAYVGDRTTDVITASLAGCISILVKSTAPEAREPRIYQRLAVARPDVTITKIPDLREYLFGKS
jgi:HAD superfamily hydrolase (TIGR01549 family)